MNKTEDKFCPDCGHHLYVVQQLSDWWDWLWCVDCQGWVEISNVLTLEQAQPLRVGYDSSARKADE